MLRDRIILDDGACEKRMSAAAVRRIDACGSGVTAAWRRQFSRFERSAMGQVVPVGAWAWQRR